MSANPIDEAVVQLRRLADVIRKHGTVPSLSLEHIANTLTAAQQQGQACECPIPMDDPPDMHAPGCVVRQPKQQGQAGACPCCKGNPGLDCNSFGRAAPPSAPVGVEIGLLRWVKAQADDPDANPRFRELYAALAQQPAAVDGVDWRAMYRFQTAMRYMDNNPQLTKERAYTMADEDCAALATQHQEQTT